MVFIATFNWGWLAAAAVVGLAAGWIAVVQRGEGLSDVMLKKIAVFVAGLVALAVLRLIPGRAGYWLDLGLVMFAVYIVGCLIGSWLRSLVLSRGAPGG